MLNTGTYSVTPAAHMSTLKPEKVSNPLAISGGWKAGDPWLVLQVSSTANGPSCYRNRREFKTCINYIIIIIQCV